MIFFVLRNRHDVSGKLQILAATLQHFPLCFENHISVIFAVHVPAMRSVVLKALCTQTPARALSSTREKLPPNTLLMLCSAQEHSIPGRTNLAGSVYLGEIFYCC